ncbi:MAG TPA: pitrilysin family protein [Vicinamibacterales bacterium]|nr:pitrilysin family protein [Vicinamibacterales bacterium]
MRITGHIRMLHVAAAAMAILSVASSAVAQTVNWPTERAPAPLAARDVKFPPYQFRTLPNGLQVIAVSHHEQPAVSLRLIVRAGGARDPEGKSGVATLLAALLDQGTTTKSAEQIASSIDSIGGLIGTGATSDLTSITAVVMKDSLGFGLDTVADLARNPKFAQDELERQRQQILSSLKVGYEDPDYVANLVFDRLVYGFNPYGKPDTGTPESIASITRDDLVAFHKAWFGANNAILAIVGDVSHEEAFAGAQRAFGDWARAENTAPKPIDPPPPTRRVVVVDRPGAVQTEIRVGNIGLPRKHPDFLALDLAINILGGEGGNRLHRVLRSDRGLTYGASADVHALKDSGNIVADTDTRSETTGEALRLMVDEFWRLQRQRVSNEELADAQAYLTGSFPLTIETPSAIALQVLNAVFYGLDLNDLQTYRERVNAITPDDIQRVAREYLRPDRLSIVLVGDASAFAKQLAGVGFDSYERISLADLDLGSADLKRHGPPAARYLPAAYTFETARMPATRTTQQHAARAGDASVRDLILRAVKAKGGIDKLRSVRTIKVTATMTFLDAPKPNEVETASYIRYPSSFRLDAMMPAGPVVQVFNGGEYWIRDARGVTTAPDAVSSQILGTVQRDSIGLLLALADGKLTATRLPDVVDGAQQLRALAISGAGMKPLTVLLDPSTDLIRAQRYQLPAGPGAVSEMEETFSEYRSIDGLQVAFMASVTRGGVQVFTRRVRTFECNVALEPSLFVKPS